MACMRKLLKLISNQPTNFVSTCFSIDGHGYLFLDGKISSSLLNVRTYVVKCVFREALFFFWLNIIARRIFSDLFSIHFHLPAKSLLRFLYHERVFREYERFVLDPQGSDKQVQGLDSAGLPQDTTERT